MLLRQWRDDDRQPYAAINQDPEVMRYLGQPRSREQSDGFVDWASGLIAERGWGLWAVEVVGSGSRRSWRASAVGVVDPLRWCWRPRFWSDSGSSGEPPGGSQ